MSYLPASKWGDCTQCPEKNVACVKKGKDLVCVECNNQKKAQEQIKKSNRRNAARNLGFKLRNTEIAGRGTEDYFMAERAALMVDLDFVHSRLVRMTAANVFGIASCFTCGRLQHWSLCQLSHFIKRQHTLTRWDLKANRCSCRYCNETLGGNLEVFAQKLNEEENGLADRLQETAREVYKWSLNELKQELISQRSKLRIVEQKFNRV